MRARKCLAIFASLAIVSGTLSTGCDRGFIDDAARASLASFVTEVISTAATEAINPDD
ncbi:MAG: hypothetical protein JSU63_01760 [Phycisphaerales bacterium]|nr:MAG: hypothetical protein JSU63_01760 [Phycisphaerales bacterium]